METLKLGERIAFNAHLSDERIAQLLWPMRFEITAQENGMKHGRIDMTTADACACAREAAVKRGGV